MWLEVILGLALLGGKARCWGRDDLGQLGDGTRTNPNILMVDVVGFASDQGAPPKVPGKSCLSLGTMSGLRKFECFSSAWCNLVLAGSKAIRRISLGQEA